jgi:hypothetical protein
VRRLAATLAVLTLALALPALAAAAPSTSWAEPQIRTAVASGLMGPSVAAFRPGAELTRGELGTIVAGITRKQGVVVAPDRTVTMTQLNRALVRAVGLAPAGAAVRRQLVAAGLTPPKRAGWETVARLLELRFNHPAEKDARERRPADPATRAEAAYSVARLLQLSDFDLVRVRSLAMSFKVPALTAWQTRVLRRAVRFVGFPYVWGGMSESRQTLFGVTSRGGFDCSGFVWRVYKLEPWSGSAKLGTTLRGRTTYDMSGEIPRADRISLARVRPGDVVFFGERGTASSPSQVTHTGIAMGGGWFVHSSRHGTTIAPLSGWWATSFAWARRPLAEAGLS